MRMKDPWYGNLVVKDISHEYLRERMNELFVLDTNMWEEVVEQCLLYFELEFKRKNE